MFKVNNKSTDDVKANISFFAYIVIIAVYTFTCLYTNLSLTYIF